MSSDSLLIIVTSTPLVYISTIFGAKIQILNMIFVSENIQARVKHKVAKHNREKTQASVYRDTKKAMEEITPEDWSKANGKQLFINSPN